MYLPCGESGGVINIVTTGCTNARSDGSGLAEWNQLVCMLLAAQWRWSVSNIGMQAAGKYLRCGSGWWQSSSCRWHLPSLLPVVALLEKTIAWWRDGNETQETQGR